MIALRDRWRAQVLAARNINDATRVLLIVLADHMTASGRVSVPRSRLAAELNRAPRQVTDRLHAAVDARWLDRVEAGRPGVTATYQALFGDPFGVKVSSRPNHLARAGMVPASAPSRDQQHGACVTARLGSLRSHQAPSVDMVPASLPPVVRECERSERVAVDLDVDLPSHRDTAASIQSRETPAQDRPLRPPSRVPMAAPREAQRKPATTKRRPPPRSQSEPVAFDTALTELFTTKARRSA